MPHYYDKDGVLIDTLQGKNGKVRNTTVKDARELNLYPSVTELLKIFDKPALNKWKVVQGIKTCLNLPCNDGETTEDWIERIYKKSGEISDDAKDFGSTIHGMIEGYLKGLPIASSELDSFWLPIKTHLDDNNFKGETEIAVVTPTIEDLAAFISFFAPAVLLGLIVQIFLLVLCLRPSKSKEDGNRFAE
jgi:hypothetical protein